jgi:hypothetical protein
MARRWSTSRSRSNSTCEGSPRSPTAISRTCAGPTRKTAPKTFTTLAPGVGCPRRCASRLSCARSAAVAVAASTVFPTASTPSAFGNPDGRPVTSNDISPRLSSTPTSPRLRPRQSCPEDDRRPRICCTATRVLALTETADATKPPGVSTSDTPPACAASLRLHANGAGEKLAVSPVRGLASPVMSLARMFTARAKARARRLQLPVACDVGSDTAVGQAATSNAAARTGMRAARVTAG